MDNGARYLGYGLAFVGVVALLIVFGMRSAVASSSGSAERPPASDQNQQTDQGWGFDQVMGLIQGLQGLASSAANAIRG